MLSIRWLPVVLCLCTAASAQTSQTPEPAELARQTLAAIDVFAEHHIAAPTRQELVRQAILAMRQSAKLEMPLGLGPRIAGLTRDEELLQLLTDEWQQAQSALAAQTTEVAAEMLLLGLLQEILAHAPGFNSISQADEHRVQQQLAANRYVGIGIALSGARDGEPPKMGVFPDGPAANAGAKDGDAILEVDGNSTEGLTLAEVVQVLRGPEGSQVELLLQQNADEPRKYTITRGVVPINHTHHQQLARDGVAIEVIGFDAITPATVTDLRKIQEQWQAPPDAVLIDLQQSAADLHKAVLLADALLDGGTIGNLVTADGSRSFEAGREALFADVPLYVVVSEVTSGTLEWLAAALQDQGRATIVGQQTAGLPFVSEPFDVPATNLVLTLATGVLQRADGRELADWERLRRNRPTAAIVHPAAEAIGAARRPARDGGVVPEHTIPTRRERPVSGEFFGGPVKIAAVLDTIVPQLKTGKAAPESE